LKSHSGRHEQSGFPAAASLNRLYRQCSGGYLQDALSVLKQCASALDHAHSRNVVHRDIKPSNIMVDAAGVIRITDFGIAKQLSSSTDLTQGAVLGTLEYMSPEQLNGGVVDGRSDQYSLAVMAYQVLTGCKVFDAQTFGAW
jgi:serine/threonine protein kinase